MLGDFSWFIAGAIGVERMDFMLFIDTIWLIPTRGWT
jgi:hypothetical protein